MVCQDHVTIRNDYPAFDYSTAIEESRLQQSLDGFLPPVESTCMTVFQPVCNQLLAMDTANLRCRFHVKQLWQYHRTMDVWTGLEHGAITTTHNFKVVYDASTPAVCKQCDDAISSTPASSCMKSIC